MSTRKSFDSDTNLAIGERIRKIRGDLTQIEFAEKLEIERTTLANYENGRRQPNNEVIKLIAGYGNISVPELIFGITKTPFDVYQERIEDEIRIQSAKNPGFIPRWYISQDEIDLIIGLRMLYDENKRLEIVKQIISSLEDSFNYERSLDSSYPPYGEAMMERLKASLNRGYVIEGYDPDAYLWATFWEEKDQTE